VLALLEKQELNYMDLMNLVEVENTGKLNYHLKILSDLITKNENGNYRLTEKGQLAVQLLLRFPEKTFKPTSLRGGDAILIGFVGFLLLLFNPGVWGIFVIGFLGIAVMALLGILYALIVPGGLMWLLTVRRTNSHDLYDLFKPPLATAVFFVLLLLVMILLNVRLTITFPISEDSGYSIILPSLPSFIASGLFFPFLGVGIFEMIYRTKIL
jgi:hypothetical protein